MGGRARRREELLRVAAPLGDQLRHRAVGVHRADLARDRGLELRLLLGDVEAGLVGREEVVLRVLLDLRRGRRRQVLGLHRAVGPLLLVVDDQQRIEEADVEPARGQVVEDAERARVGAELRAGDGLDRLHPHVAGDRAQALAREVLDRRVVLARGDAHRGRRVVRRVGEQPLRRAFLRPRDAANRDVDAVRLHTAEHPVEVRQLRLDLQVEPVGDVLQDLAVEADDLRPLDRRIGHVGLRRHPQHAGIERVQARGGTVCPAAAAAGHQQQRGDGCAHTHHRPRARPSSAEAVRDGVLLHLSSAG
jgi:hypothetical protein